MIRNGGNVLHYAVVLLFALSAPPAEDTAIVGATLIDVSNEGHSSADIANSVVVISGGRIVAAGDRARVRIPAHANVLNAAGRYIIPGLIDGYGALRTQSFANAYLYEGVTTVIIPLAPKDGSVDGETTFVAPRNGLSALTTVPIGGYSTTGAVPIASPWIHHRLNDPRLDEASLAAQVRAAAAAGHRAVAAGLDVWPEQLDAIVAAAHRLGLAVTAQVAFTDYPRAVKAGVDAFTRNDKYSLMLSAPRDFAAYADDPRGPGGRLAARAVCGDEDINGALAAFGALLAKSHTALMPALSMEATADDIGGPNPWSTRSAAFVTPADLDDPVDARTGARPYLESHPDRREKIQECARRKQDIDRHLHALGTTYIAGTSSPSFGVMPGGGLHGELRLLSSIGLTPREALAAATSTIAHTFRLSDRGVLAAGRRADLVVLSADPRIDVSAIDSIDRVMVGGHFVDRDRMMESATGHPALPAPAIFGPGIISGPGKDGAPTFSPDAHQLFFERTYAKRTLIFESHLVNARWSVPRVAPFAGPWSDQQPALSQDGRYLVYASYRRRASTAPGVPGVPYDHLWRVDRTKTGWSAPVELPAAVNISDLMFKPTIARNGDLYFMSAASRGPDRPRWQLYCATWRDGAYQPAQPLSFSDSTSGDVDPYIAPDESYIVFSSSGRRSPDDTHEHLYVSLRSGSEWGPPRPLRYDGDDWNADDGEANVSPDGRTLYFTSDRSAPVDRTESRAQMLDEVRRYESWDNGNNNAWSLPLRQLFEANGITIPPSR
jgi:amidohydrolase family protein/WD40 repeat protein